MYVLRAPPPRRVIVSQAIRQKLQLHRRAAAAPEPLEEDKARLLLGDRTVSTARVPHACRLGVARVPYVCCTCAARMLHVCCTCAARMLHVCRTTAFLCRPKVVRLLPGINHSFSDKTTFVHFYICYYIALSLDLMYCIIFTHMYLWAMIIVLSIYDDLCSDEQIYMYIVYIVVGLFC